MTTPVWISLGSNLGDRRAILDEALALLNQTPGVVVSAVSSDHETQPVGGPTGQGAFLNAAARLDTTLDPRPLLAATQAVENQLGRVRTVRWGERTLDIDLLIFGGKFVDAPDLKLPHPRLPVRRFVLEPLAEIAPEIVDTITRRTVADLLANLDRRPWIVMLDRSIMRLSPEMHKLLATELGGRSLALTAPVAADLRDPPCQPIWSTYHHDLCRLATLQAAFAAEMAGNPRWTVANFAVDVPRTRKAIEPIAESRIEGPVLARAKVDQPKLWYINQISRLLRDVPDPTLIVTAAKSAQFRRPGITRTPIYWPEVTDPIAIVTEVAAICRGIEAVC